METHLPFLFYQLQHFLLHVPVNSYRYWRQSEASLWLKETAHTTKAWWSLCIYTSRKERTQMDLKSECENLLCEKPQL